MDNRPWGPELEELHDSVMEVIGDYIDFDYSFDHNEMRGNADEGDTLEEITLWNDDYDFEVTIERGYKQRADGPDMNWQGSDIEGDYDAYVKWLNVKWPGVYQEALDEWKAWNADNITDEDKAVIENG